MKAENVRQRESINNKYVELNLNWFWRCAFAQPRANDYLTAHTFAPILVGGSSKNAQIFGFKFCQYDIRPLR